MKSKRRRTKYFAERLRKRITQRIRVEGESVVRLTWEEAGKLADCTPEMALEVYKQYLPHWPMEHQLFPVGVNKGAWDIPLETLPTLTEKAARKYVWGGPYAGFVICASKNGGFLAAKNTLRITKRDGLEGFADKDLTAAREEGIFKAAIFRDLQKQLQEAQKPMRFLESVTVSTVPQLVG
jgi:hypothetical protein